MDFFKAPWGTMLGLNDGAVRLDCPPGTVKAYLPEWPWEECVPESEMLNPTPAVLPPPSPAPQVILLRGRLGSFEAPHKIRSSRMSAHLSGMNEDLQLFNDLRGDLVPNFVGQYALIGNGDLVGTFPTYQAALDAATLKFGAAEGSQYLYLIKEVLVSEPVETL